MRLGGAIAALLLLAAAEVGAQTLDLSGDLKFQGRWYPQSPAFPGQRSGTAGLVVEPTLYWESAEGASFTFTPLYRYDSADSRRTHGDLREAYMLVFGDWGENSWELRLGLDRVFWGVAELRNLVDVVNQTDLVEHPRDRPKLGQPMVHLTMSGHWGVAESFLLPYHRKRTFPGRTGRHRSGLPIEADALYESGAEERRLDFAFRYSNAVDSLDFGISAFTGTSREPTFVASPRSRTSPANGTILIPYYERIRQFGLDAQLTTDPWLYKMEAIRRSGARNLLGREQDYGAFIFGLERTLGAPFGSSADLTILAEWHYDGRGRRATGVWANDLYVSGLLAFNDTPGTELLAGLLGDLRHDSRSLNLELKRRLSAGWSLRLEAMAILSADRRDPVYDGRRDSFVGMELAFSF